MNSLPSECVQDTQTENITLKAIDGKLFHDEFSFFCFYLQFVLNGIFKAELNEFLTRQLAEDGYSGVEIRVTPTRTEIIIMATKTLNVLGEKGRRIRELTAVVQKR